MFKTFGLTQALNLIQKTSILAAILYRPPDDVTSLRPFLYRLCQRGAQPVPLLLGFKRRIDEDETAPALWRQVGVQCDISVNVGKSAVANFCLNSRPLALASSGLSSQRAMVSCLLSNACAIAGDPG